MNTLNPFLSAYHCIKQPVNYACLHHFNRKQLELRLQPGGADFREAVAKEVASVEERHAQREVELQEKLADSRKQYAALEDEFRMALTIEAARFSEVCLKNDRHTDGL